MVILRGRPQTGSPFTRGQAQGLDPWLRRMLAPPGAAPPEGRFGSAEEALSALQEARVLGFGELGFWFP